MEKDYNAMTALEYAQEICRDSLRRAGKPDADSFTLTAVRMSKPGSLEAIVTHADGTESSIVGAWAVAIAKRLHREATGIDHVRPLPPGHYEWTPEGFVKVA